MLQVPRKSPHCVRGTHSYRFVRLSCCDGLRPVCAKRIGVAAPGIGVDVWVRAQVRLRYADLQPVCGKCTGLTDFGCDGTIVLCGDATGGF